MSNETEFWAGEFGNEYTNRNRVDWRGRIPFWGDVMHLTGARSVHEVGVNCGWNLSAIQQASFQDVVLTGNDVNARALEQAGDAGLNVWEGEDIRRAELIFTAGVLIHVAPAQLQALMEQIKAASYRYVLAVEYHDEQETEVAYRGHAGKLWRRNYGKLYQDLGLTLVKQWDAGMGFDQCTAYLLEKP